MGTLSGTAFFVWHLLERMPAGARVVMGNAMKSAFLTAAVVLMMLSGCDGRSEREVQGYVEGDFVRISLPSSGVVESVRVNRGDRVSKGDLLFTLDSEREASALSMAEAELAVAEAELDNLRASGRSDEIRVLEAEINELKAHLAYASASHRRKRGLSREGGASVDEVDRLQSEEQITRAKIRAAESRLRLAQNSIGRDGEIEAARQTREYRSAAMREAAAKLALRRAVAPADAVVNDVIYRPGETVSAGQTVVELLPPENVKVRFFLSPEQVGWVAAESEVLLQCVGCGEGIEARVSYIAPRASYRPPILYSRNQSEKLVFLVEAIPQSSVERLHPGQPLTVVFPR